ncbi:MAG: hypothetical protein NVSMB27_33040 [Ktedonobacteraceae bacterium]
MTDLSSTTILTPPDVTIQIAVHILAVLQFLLRRKGIGICCLQGKSQRYSLVFP